MTLGSMCFINQRKSYLILLVLINFFLKSLDKYMSIEGQIRCIRFRSNWVSCNISQTQKFVIDYCVTQNVTLPVMRNLLTFKIFL